MHHRIKTLLPVVITLFAACRATDDAKSEHDATAAPDAGGSYAVAWKQEDCLAFDAIAPLLATLPPDKAAAGAKTLTCGHLTVPENRGAPAGNRITLSVVAARATKPASPANPPLVMITGGPSTPSTDLLSIVATNPSLRAERDVLLVGERGEQYADPQLNCPGLDALADGVFGADGFVHPITTEQKRPILAACHASTVARGIDLSAYNVKELVTDIHDAAKALGYPKYHVYGVSFGTGAAQQLAKLFPDEVTSLVLDSPTVFDNSYDEKYGLVGNPHLDAGRAVTDAWRTLFATCKSDAQCNAKYPDLEATFRAMLADYDAAPARFDVAKPGDTSGRTYGLRITGELVYQTLSNSFKAQLIPFIPQIIYGLAARDPGAIATFGKQAAAFLVPGPDVSMAMEKSVTCSAWNWRDPSDLPTKDVDELAKKYMDPFTISEIVTCRDAWKVPQLRQSWPEFHDPLVRDEAHPLPALILPGRYDANTHPAKADQIASRLSPRSFVHVAPDRGHVVIDACTIGMMVAFMKDPSRDPDASCLAALTTKFQ